MLSEQQLYDLHDHYSYNCLSWENFLLFLASEDFGCSFRVDCDECGKFYPPEDSDSDNRCCCGNRRCYVQATEHNGELYFSAEVD